MIAWYYISVMATFRHQNIPIRFLDILRQPKKLHNLPQKTFFWILAAIIVTHSETTQRKSDSMVLYVCTSIVLTMTRSCTVSPASELDMVFSIRTVYSSRYIHAHTTIIFGSSSTGFLSPLFSSCIFAELSLLEKDWNSPKDTYPNQQPH